MRKYLPFAVLLLLSVVLPTHAQDMTPLPFDEIITGETSPIQSRFNYTFEASPDEMIYITIRGQDVTGDFDMRLFDSAQNPIAESRTLFEGGLIGPLAVPEAGTYILSAGRPDWSDINGPFDLFLSTTTIIPFDANTTIDGTLPHHMSIAFYVADDLQAGDIVRWKSDIINGGYVVENESGVNELAEYFYDSPFVPVYRVAVTEPHPVAIQTALPDGADYALTLSRLIFADIQPNESVEIPLDEDNLALLRFDSPAGKTWDIVSTMPEDGDGYMALLDLSGRPQWEARLREDYGTGANGSPRIAQFAAPEDSAYYILLEFDDYNENETVNVVTVALQSSTVISLVNGIEQTGTVTTETGNIQYQYSGKAGERIRVTFSRLSEVGELSLMMLSPDDEVVVFNGRGVASSSFEIVLPLDGQYLFSVRDNAYNASQMDFSLLITSS
jgi:hypothetical protein